MIEIERQRWKLLLNDQQEEDAKWKEENERRENAKKKLDDDATLQRFLEEKLRETNSDRREMDATRRFAAAVKENPSTDNLINLLTNYQGK